MLEVCIELAFGTLARVVESCLLKKIDYARKKCKRAQCDNSDGNGKHGKSPGTRNQCMGRSEICIEDIFRGQKSQGLAHRRAVNTFHTEIHENDRIWQSD